ncbi:toprim domain-containing protein [Candidatus Woesearchaeota archaeon]|nr:toprim domain-containing protein [Candidatus Woesearchaeota archaeon]
MMVEIKKKLSIGKEVDFRNVLPFPIRSKIALQFLAHKKSQMDFLVLAEFNYFHTIIKFRHYAKLSDHINTLINENTLIVVEGIKDKTALNRLGITNIITLNRPLFSVVEQIAQQTNECVVLTDLDAEGKKLYSRLSNDLQRHGVKINNKLRHFLFKETQLRQIEGIERLFP